MGYKKHNFTAGMVLKAKFLDEMEDQILKNESVINGAPSWDFTTDYMRELNRVVNTVSAIQTDKGKHTVEFIVFSDLHKNTVSAHPEFARMMQAINYLTHNLDIKFVAGLGDYIDNPVKESNYNVYDEIDSALQNLNSPFINIMGNHDYIAHIYRRNYMTNFENAVFDTVGSWFYVDDMLHAIRYIVLDDQDRSNDANKWVSLTTSSAAVVDRSWKQLNWLANVALKTTNKVILLSHQSLDSKHQSLISSQTNIDNYFKTCDILHAFEDGTSGSVNYIKYYSDETTANDTVEFDFTKQGKGVVLFHIHGHTHGDIFYNPNYTNVSGVTSSFNEIAIDDALYSTTSHIGTHHEKTLNTVNEVAFDIVSVDLIESIVTCYRFGAGDNRKCVLNGALSFESYEDDIVDGVNITSEFTFNNNGAINYKNGTTNTGNGGTTVDENWVYNDYVDVSEYTAINIVMPVSSNSASLVGCAFYDENKTYILGEQVGISTALDIESREITIPSGAKYIRTTWPTSKLSGFNSSWKFSCYGIQ